MTATARPIYMKLLFIRHAVATNKLRWIIKVSIFMGKKLFVKNCPLHDVMALLLLLALGLLCLCVVETAVAGLVTYYKIFIPQSAKL